MAPEVAGLLAATALLVVVLALYLIVIAVNLKKISEALDIVLSATVGIANQVKPAPGVVGSIARDVGAIQSALHGLIALATGGAAPAAPAAAAAPAPAARRSRIADAPVDSGVTRRTPPPIHAGRRR